MHVHILLRAYDTRNISKLSQAIGGGIQFPSVSILRVLTPLILINFMMMEYVNQKAIRKLKNKKIEDHRKALADDARRLKNLEAILEMCLKGPD